LPQFDVQIDEPEYWKSAVHYVGLASAAENVCAGEWLHFFEKSFKSEKLEQQTWKSFNSDLDTSFHKKVKKEHKSSLLVDYTSGDEVLTGRYAPRIHFILVGNMINDKCVNHLKYQHKYLDRLVAPVPQRKEEDGEATRTVITNSPDDPSMRPHLKPKHKEQVDIEEIIIEKPTKLNKPINEDIIENDDEPMPTPKKVTSRRKKADNIVKVKKGEEEDT